MKNIVLIASVFALSFATGFTCSKNAPEQTAQPTQDAASAPTDQQAQMAASSDTAQPAAQPASSDAQPAPQTETK